MNKKGGAWIFVLIVVVILLFVSLILASFVSLLFGGESIALGNVAVIPITGAIVTENGGGLLAADATESGDTIELIDKAEKNPQIHAIVFEINSPGGSAVASDEIGQRIKKTEKPTVAWIREVGASGGYWVASATDHIIANRMSITGSIGVIASYLQFSGLLEDYNVTYERMVSGKYKDLGSPFKELTPSERMLFQAELDRIHDFFVSEVAQNRNLPKSRVDELATGLFFTGVRAQELGLVDKLGSEPEVEAYLEDILGQEVKFVEYKKKTGFFEQLSEAMSRQFYSIGQGIGSSVFSHGTTLESGLRT